MSLVEDGTITTQENEMYQDEMIEDLFSTDNFSEEDTCVEIMGTTRAVRGSSLASRRSYKSASSQSRKSKKGERRSSAAENIAVADNSVTTAPGARMQPIDEDVHSLVREDVRRMIAKIRSTKQPKKPQKIEEEEEKTDKMLVNPGKYGEVDLRSPSAIERKKLFKKIKKDNAKARKSSKKNRPSTVPDGQSESSSRQEGQREGVRDEHASEAEKKRELRQKPDDWTKKGYYKNKHEDGPEHTVRSEVKKGKSTRSSKQPEQFPSNGSVASRKSASQSVVSNKSSTRKIKITSGGSSVVSTSKQRKSSGVAPKSRPPRTGGDSIASKKSQQQHHRGSSSVTSGKSQHRQPSNGCANVVSKSQQQASGNPSVVSKSHRPTSLPKSPSNGAAPSHVPNTGSKGGGSTVMSKGQSKSGNSTNASNSNSKSEESDETTSTPSTSQVHEARAMTEYKPRTIEPEDQKESELKGKQPKNEQPRFQAEAEGDVDGDTEVEAAVVEAEQKTTIDATENTSSPTNEDNMVVVEDATAKTVSSDEIDLSPSEWKEPHQPLLSMLIAQFGGASEIDDSEEIECVLAPFAEVAPDPVPVAKPDPSVGSGHQHTQENQERGVGPPGEKADLSDAEESDCRSQTSLPEAIDNVGKLDLNDDISSILALSNVSGVKPITVMSIKQVEPPVGEAVFRGLAVHKRIREDEIETPPPPHTPHVTRRSLIAAMQRDIGSFDESSSRREDTTEVASIGEETGGGEIAEETTGGETTGADTTTGEDTTGEETAGADETGDEVTVELVLVDDSVRLKQLEAENAKLKDTLNFLQQTAVEKEKYFAELAWFGKRSEEEVQKWRPNFWRERLEDLGPELFEEFRADAMRIADPDVGDWEHGFSSGSLAMARLLLGISHAVDDEKICAFHDPGQPCTKHCVTCSVAEQRKRELADFPVLDP